MKEIGGYMEIEHYNGTEYYSNLLHLNTGRNAIVLAALEKQYTKIWIPHYLCDCVSLALNKNGIDFDYYNLNSNFEPDQFNTVCRDGVAILLVNYFGMFNNDSLVKKQKRFGNIIVDNTHSFFQSRVSSIDTIYTARKYFGVPDGAYLHLTCPSKYYENLEDDYSHIRMNYLAGRFECSANQFYDEFCISDRCLEHEKIKKMSSLTKNILCSIDYDRVILKRTENFNVLHNALKSINQYEVLNHGGLYMYPLLLNNGYLIKRQLIEKKVYVPTLWPNVLKDCFLDSYEYYLANNMLFLPIDQRYDCTDMQYMLNIIEAFL